MSAPEPVFNAPAVVLILLTLLVAVHVGREVLPEEVGTWLLVAGSFVPGRLSEGTTGVPGGRTAAVSQFFTYMLLHGDLAHLMLNAAWLLIFGSVVARRFGSLRFLVLSLGCGVVAAMAHQALETQVWQPMIGASGAVSGLMGAALRLLFPAIDQYGAAVLNRSPEIVVVPPVAVALRDQRLLMAIAAIVVLNVLMALGVFSLLAEGGIAWAAHLGGFFAGLFGFSLLDPVRHRAAPNLDRD